MAPPYDIVPPETKESLYRRSPHNIIRIDFGKDSPEDNEQENRYTRSAESLREWLRQGVFIQDKEDSFYCYEILYSFEGRKKNLRGFLGAVRLEEFGKGRIHPHEMTYSKPKSDRLKILRYCHANTSPIFALYSSGEKLASSVLEGVATEKPFIEAKDGSGFLHRLWRITESREIESIKKELASQDVFIADGHHRYETALAFREEMREKGLIKSGKEPFNYVLMFLANMEDEGLTLLPTHRIVEIDLDINPKIALRKHFSIKKISDEGVSGRDATEKMLETMKRNNRSFGMFLTNSNTYYTLSYTASDIDEGIPECLRNLDVTILHNLIFEKLLHIERYEYEKDPYIAVERAKKGSFEAVFFLNPTDVKDVKNVALADQRMPPKSTYFYPKLLTGMVLYKF